MDTVFAVDHILELIFNNLSGRDLLNCQLVSCEWFIVARKVLSRRRSSYFYLSDSNILQINPKTVKGDAKIEGVNFAMFSISSEENCQIFHFYSFCRKFFGSNG